MSNRKPKTFVIKIQASVAPLDDQSDESECVLEIDVVAYTKRAAVERVSFALGDFFDQFADAGPVRAREQVCDKMNPFSGPTEKT